MVRKGGQKLTPKQVAVLALIKANPFISRKTLSAKLGINPSAVQKHLDVLKNKEIIKRIGADKGGHWDWVAQNYVAESAAENKEINATD